MNKIIAVSDRKEGRGRKEKEGMIQKRKEEEEGTKEKKERRGREGAEGRKRKE
jgi:hypothetical protein